MMKPVRCPTETDGLLDRLARAKNSLATLADIEKDLLAIRGLAMDAAARDRLERLLQLNDQSRSMFLGARSAVKEQLARGRNALTAEPLQNSRHTEVA